MKNNKQIKVISITKIIQLDSDKSSRVSAYFELSKLYLAFINLYLMSYSTCVTYGKFSFGKLEAKMPREKCVILYSKDWCEVEWIEIHSKVKLYQNTLRDQC